MRRLLLALAVLCCAGAVRAEGDRTGQFDYYILALTWSPAWCALTRDAHDDPQCAPDRDLTFVLHGLWPQHAQGWPSDCPTTEDDPPPALTKAMIDIMGKAWLVRHQWQKHGRCSGLSADAYFRAARTAFASIRLPSIFTSVDRPLTLPAQAVEAAFLDANPQLAHDQITITCKSGRVYEVRVCLTRDLEPRRCGQDVIRDCTLDRAILEPVP